MVTPAPILGAGDVPTVALLPVGESPSLNSLSNSLILAYRRCACSAIIKHVWRSSIVSLGLRVSANTSGLPVTRSTRFKGITRFLASFSL
jgi:hypothetical protein